MKLNQNNAKPKPRPKREVAEAKVSELLRSRYSNFQPKALLDDGIFERAEEIGAVTLNEGHRRLITQHIHDFEFFRDMQSKKYGPELKALLKRLENDLQKAARAAELLDSIPGHLWSFANNKAGTATSAKDMSALAQAMHQLNESVAKTRGGDFFLNRLLSQLAGVFEAAGGKGLSVYRRKDRHRYCRFTAFAEVLTAALPEPLTKLASRWERVSTAKAGQAAFNWIGQPPPILAAATRTRPTAVAAGRPPDTRK